MKKFVEVDVPRFKAYCTAFGGQRRMSIAAGVSQEYLENRLNRHGGTIRLDVFNTACDLHSFPKELLTGHGSDEEFKRLLANKVAMERLAKRRGKHKMCDSYCEGCRYECWAAATAWSPPERFCDYYYQTQKVRGCPAGQGCTRREPRKGGAERAKVGILFGNSLLSFRR